MFQSPVFTSRVFNSGVFTPMQNRRGVESQYCLGFDGVDDRVNVTVASEIEFGTSSFAVSLWLSTSHTSDMRVLGTYSDGSSRGWGLYINPAGLVDFFCYGSLGSIDTSIGSSIANGSWHHLVGVFSRSGNSCTLTTYVDGRPAGSTTATVGDIASGSATFQVGRYSTAGDKFFNGRIDDLRIDSRALTADEVSAIYNNVTAPPTTGLVAHFPFEEGTGASTVDSVGGLVGTLTNGPTWQPQTPPRLIRNRETEDWSPSFDGVDDEIIVPHHASLNIVGQISIAAWVRTDGDNRYIVTKNTDSFYLGCGVGTSTKFGFYLNGPSDTSGGWLSGTTTITDNQWHHVAATWDGATLRVYVDGREENSRSASGTMTTGTADLRIGNRPGFGRFKGNIKDVCIYSSALPVASIAKLARGVEPDEAPVARWRLNEGTGTTANDSIGSNHGTLTNGPTWTGDVPQHFRQAIVSTQSLSLDGVDDAVQTLFTTNGAGISTGQFCSSFWFRTPSTTSSAKSLLDCLASGAGGFEVLFRGDSSPKGLSANRRSAMGINVASLYATAVNDDRWHHVIYQLTSSATELWVDGVLVDSDTNAPLNIASSTQLRLGVAPDGTGNFAGFLDDPAIYTRGLSAAEVADAAAGYLVTAGLVSRWKLDGDVQDSVGSNHGTEQGGVGYSTSVPGTL